MPIKLNGTTILDETTLANKDLSNISSAGNNVINNIANNVIDNALNTTIKNYVESYVNSAVANVLKHINFANAVNFTASYSGGVSKKYTDYTIPSTGYFIIIAPGNGYIISNKTYNLANILFPVKASTTIRTVVTNVNNQASTTGWFFPQIS